MAELITLRRTGTGPAGAGLDHSARLQAVIGNFAAEFERLQAEHRRRTELLLAKTVTELSAAWPTPLPADVTDETGRPVCLGEPVWWSEIEFTIFNEHELMIGTPREKRNFGYQELQLHDDRNGTPKDNWRTLLRLAALNGVLSRPPISFEHKHDGGWSKTKKDIQALRKWLRGRFQILEDPLPFSDGGYRARFKISLAGRYRHDLIHPLHCS